MDPQENTPVEIPVSAESRDSVFNSPLLWAAMGIMACLTVGLITFYFISSKRSVPPATTQPIVTEIPTITTSSDLPPLFPGVEWEATTSGMISFVDSSRNTIERQGYRENSIFQASFSQDLINYYLTQLNNGGWVKTLEAGGDSGVTYGYQKNNSYFNFGYKYDGISKYQMYIEYN